MKRRKKTYPGPLPEGAGTKRFNDIVEAFADVPEPVLPHEAIKRAREQLSESMWEKLTSNAKQCCYKDSEISALEEAIWRANSVNDAPAAAEVAIRAAAGRPLKTYVDALLVLLIAEKLC